MANLEYLLLTPETLAAGYPVSDQEAQEYYDKNKVRFFQPESFRARHIFIACPPDGYLGDIAICLERAEEQAEEYGHSLERELAFLAVHGSLHLLGYDHMKPQDEQTMFAKQTEILNAMGITR